MNVVSLCFCKKLAVTDFADVFFDGLAHNRRLVLAERHDDDLAGFHDGADAHRQRLVRHVFLAEEIARSVAARHWIERDGARSAMARRAGFVEADVPAAADAEDLQIDAARPANLLFVAGAIFLDIGVGIMPSGMWMFSGLMLMCLKNVSCIQSR